VALLRRFFDNLRTTLDGVHGRHGGERRRFPSVKSVKFVVEFLWLRLAAPGLIAPYRTLAHKAANQPLPQTPPAKIAARPTKRLLSQGQSSQSRSVKPVKASQASQGQSSQSRRVKPVKASQAGQGESSQSRRVKPVKASQGRDASQNPSQSCLHAALPEQVQAHRHDDDDADDDFLREILPAHLVGPVAQHRHDHRPDHRTKNAPRPAA
jgi:hypothetical protein